MNPETVKTTVNRLLDAMKERDFDRWLTCFADDVKNHNPVGTPPLQGHEAMKRVFQNTVGGFTDWKLTVESMFVAGNEAAVKYTATGKMKNGKMVVIDGINVYEVNDAGKVQTVRAYWHPAEVAAQMKKQ
jgi:steroid delta-isomerase